MNEIDKRFLEKMRSEYGATGEALGRVAIDIMQAVDWLKNGSGFVHGLVTWVGLLAVLFLSGALVLYIKSGHGG